MPQSIQSPFELLLDIERRGIKHAAGLPQQEEVTRPWSGIGFKIGDLHLVSAVGDVNEILHFPQVTAIPGTKPWVKGMANIRGNLIPIIDLNGYLGHSSTHLNNNSRVLIINNADLWAGLLVDKVLGLKHFYDEEQVDEKPETEDSLVQYLSGGYEQNKDNWYVFSMKSLAENPDFYQVSM